MLKGTFKKPKPITIYGETILPGESKQINLYVAKLHTRTTVEIPVIVERSDKPGPVLLLIGGIHGDEVNGIEIIRRVIRKGYNKPEAGTVICIPVFNVFGFINLSRDFPDGRDMNRLFPGSSKGSLAGRFAWLFMKEIAPVIDYALDFHTGGAQRHNHPQCRCTFDDPVTVEIAKEFGAPYLIKSALIGKSFRASLHKKGIPVVVFEGGKSLDFDEPSIVCGIKGVLNVMEYLKMRKVRKKTRQKSLVIESAQWIRSPSSGLFMSRLEDAEWVKKGQLLGFVTDPYGEYEIRITSPYDGHIFCINTSTVVNKGDALFHIGLDEPSSGSGIKLD